MQETIMITFSGIDGAGKTALANRTCDYLRIEGIKVKRYKVYDKSIFLNMGRLLGKISNRAKTNLESRFASGHSQTGGRLGGLRRFCFRIDIAIFKLKMFTPRVRGPRLVCDRYLYDILVHLKYLKVVNDKQYELFLKRIPRPDLPILLLVNEDAAKKREGQHRQIEYYREKLKLYERLGKRMELISIDSSRELETVWGEVKGMVDSRLR